MEGKNIGLCARCVSAVKENAIALLVGSLAVDVGRHLWYIVNS